MVCSELKSPIFGNYTLEVSILFWVSMDQALEKFQSEKKQHPLLGQTLKTGTKFQKVT